MKNKDFPVFWNSIIFRDSNIFLQLPTGSGKTLFAPLRIARQYNCKVLIVVPRKFLVLLNVKYHQRGTKKTRKDKNRQKQKNRTRKEKERKRIMEKFTKKEKKVNKV